MMDRKKLFGEAVSVYDAPKAKIVVSGSEVIEVPRNDKFWKLDVGNPEAPKLTVNANGTERTSEYPTDKKDIFLATLKKIQSTIQSEPKNPSARS